MKRRIKVGEQIYKIVDKNMVEDDSKMGLFVSYRNKIFVDPTVAKCKYESTVAHELIHMLIYESGAGELLKDELDESITGILENTFYSFLKNNTNFYD